MNKQLVIGSVAGALAVTAIAAVGGYRMLDKGNYAEVLAVGADVALLVPGPARMGRLERLRRGRTGARLTRLLAPNPRVHVMLVRDHPHRDDVASAVVLPARTFHRAVVLVDRPDRAALLEEFTRIHLMLRCDASQRAADAVLELVAGRQSAR